MKEKKKCLSLFDAGDRSDRGYMKPSESLYAFLNRSAWFKSEIRNLLEQWFCGYPSEQRDDVCQRFRKKNIVQHNGALFELYCSALLHGHSFRIEAHPDTSRSTHPEFLVYSENTPLFYLESRIATLGEIELNNQVQLQLLISILNFIDSPDFFIDITVNSLPSKTSSGISVGDVRKCVENFLKKYSYQEVSELLIEQSQSALAIKYWVEGEWDFLVELIPKSPEQQKRPASPSLSSVSFPAQWTSDVEQCELESLTKAIKDKADRYGDFEIPYIVAINVLPSEEEMVPYKAFSSKDGLWPRLSSTEGKQRVSAVLFVPGLNCWSIIDTVPILWHNPYADKPLSKEIWQGTQIILDKGQTGMWRNEGKSVKEIFKFPSN